MPIALIVLVLVVAVVLAATWPGFVTKTIVVSGNARVRRNEIVSRAGIVPHVSIWLQNTAAISKRIEAIPYVDRARVRQIPPSTLRIVVSERRPFAILRSGDDAALVDRSLRVLEPAATSQSYPVLIIDPGTSLEPGEFVLRSSARGLRDAYERVGGGNFVPASLQYDRFGGLIVTTRGGLRLLFGSETDLSQKITLADAILSQVVTHKRRVAAIDLRAPSAPVVVYR